MLYVWKQTKIKMSKEDITLIKKDTMEQSKGTNFFKHRAGRIGASQRKSALHSNW